MRTYTPELENPVQVLPKPNFLALLRTIVDCHKATNQRTKTSIELALGLKILEGKAPAQDFERVRSDIWGWRDLKELKIDPLVMFCYARMFEELTGLTLPESRTSSVLPAPARPSTA